MNEWFPTFKKIPQTPLRDLLRLHFSGRLSWQARVAESDLPEIARQKIVDVVKATKLWRLEKSQIADELIAHFVDGQERGLNINALVEKFGDTATVAPLMRSAKKRNRSLVWKTFVVGCYAFVAFLIFYAGLAVWFFSGKPNPSVDYYAVVSSEAAAVPEDQRAWPIYRQAWIEHDFVQLNIGKLVGQVEDDQKGWNEWRPGDEKWPAVVEFLNGHDSLVQAIRLGGQRPGFGLELKRRKDYSKADALALFGSEDSDKRLMDKPPETQPTGTMSESLLDDALIGALLSQVQEMRTMARILQVDIVRAAEAGDSDVVQEDLLAMAGLGPQAGELPFLVCGLVGLALDGITYRTTQELLEQYPDLLNEKQLSAIESKVRRLSPHDYVSLEGERALQQDLVQRIFSDDGTGDGRLTYKGLSNLRNVVGMAGGEIDDRFSTVIGLVGPGVAFVSGSRKQTEQSLNGVMDEFASTFGSPVYQTPMRDNDWFEGLIEKYASRDIGTKFLMQTLLPAVEQVRVATERVEGYRNGTLVGLAANRYRLANKRFPKSIDELTPKWIESVSIDVVSGKPLNYRLADGKPLIYSVGADLDDDGGAEAVDSDGKTVRDANQHLYSGNSSKIDGDWILWPTEND